MYSRFACITNKESNHVMVRGLSGNMIQKHFVLCIGWEITARIMSQQTLKTVHNYGTNGGWTRSLMGVQDCGGTSAEFYSSMNIEKEIAWEYDTILAYPPDFAIGLVKNYPLTISSPTFGRPPRKGSIFNYPDAGGYLGCKESAWVRWFSHWEPNLFWLWS